MTLTLRPSQPASAGFNWFLLSDPPTQRSLAFHVSLSFWSGLCDETLRRFPSIFTSDCHSLCFLKAFYVTGKMNKLKKKKSAEELCLIVTPQEQLPQSPATSFWAFKSVFSDFVLYYKKASTWNKCQNKKIHRKLSQQSDSRWFKRCLWWLCNSSVMRRWHVIQVWKVLINKLIVETFQSHKLFPQQLQWCLSCILSNFCSQICMLWIICFWPQQTMKTFFLFHLSTLTFLCLNWRHTSEQMYVQPQREAAGWTSLFLHKSNQKLKYLKLQRPDLTPKSLKHKHVAQIWWLSG